MPVKRRLPSEPSTAFSVNSENALQRSACGKGVRFISGPLADRRSVAASLCPLYRGGCEVGALGAGGFAGGGVTRRTFGGGRLRSPMRAEFTRVAGKRKRFTWNIAACAKSSSRVPCDSVPSCPYLAVTDAKKYFPDDADFAQLAPALRKSGQFARPARSAASAGGTGPKIDGRAAAPSMPGERGADHARPCVFKITKTRVKLFFSPMKSGRANLQVVVGSSRFRFSKKCV